MSEVTDTEREIGTLWTEVGDKWRVVLDHEGQPQLEGSDIDWTRRHAWNHDLVLDSAESLWLKACLAIARRLRPDVRWPGEVPA